MKLKLKLLYVLILMAFLPAHTQMRNTDSSATVKPDSVRSLEIDKIKRSVLIDLWLVKFRIKRRVHTDSLRQVRDSIIEINDTAKKK